jgi:glycosyltransferase involved in cell wall biosynthesis
MKVLHVEMGRHLYGGARQVAYLLNGLNRFPGEHVLVCAQDGEIAGAIQNPKVKIYPLAMQGDLDIGFIARLRHIIRVEQPDLLHVHSRRGDFLSALTGKFAALPMILSRRVDNPPRWVDRKLKFPFFERVITISGGIREVLLKYGVPTERIICVLSAVDTERYRPEPDWDWFRRQFGLSEAPIVLGIVAQLIPRKGHKVLFDGLVEVLPHYDNIVLLVFGKGPLESELKRYVEAKGLGRFVRFAGFRTDMERVLPCLDMLIHPAWMEGLGVSLLEAASCGVPIIGTRAGGIPEIVEEGVNGYLVNPGDVTALANRITQLACSPECRRSFGQAARRLVLERFSIERMVKGNYQIYSSLALGRSTP